MGRKQTRARELIYFCASGLIMLALFSCALVVEKDKVEVKREETSKQGIQKEDLQKNKTEFKREEAARERIQKRDLQKEEAVKTLSEHLLRARQLLEQRDFEGSLKENQKILSLSSQNPPADVALFNMGLIYAHFGNPKKDYSKSVGFFRRLMKEYPESPLVEQAKIWTGILQESEKLSQTIQKLNQVIEESKYVDIEIEEKKREKAK
jgi:tetratricopeptide (TPR) repeat protein